MKPVDESLLRAYESGDRATLERRAAHDGEAARLLFLLVSEEKKGMDLFDALGLGEEKPSALRVLWKASRLWVDQALADAFDARHPALPALRDRSASLVDEERLEVNGFLLRATTRGVIVRSAQGREPLRVERKGALWFEGPADALEALPLGPGSYRIAAKDRELLLDLVADDADERSEGIIK